MAVLCTLNTLFSALAMVLMSAVCALNALANAALLTAACDAASPTRVCEARSAEIFESADAAAAALALLAAAAIEAACSVAGFWAEARALSPARTKRDNFIVTVRCRFKRVWCSRSKKSNGPIWNEEKAEKMRRQRR